MGDLKLNKVTPHHYSPYGLSDSYWDGSGRSQAVLLAVDTFYLRVKGECLWGLRQLKGPLFIFCSCLKYDRVASFLLLWWYQSSFQEVMTLGFGSLLLPENPLQNLVASVTIPTVLLVRDFRRSHLGSRWHWLAAWYCTFHFQDCLFTLRKVSSVSVTCLSPCSISTSRPSPHGLAFSRQWWSLGSCTSHRVVMERKSFKFN